MTTKDGMFRWVHLFRTHYAEVYIDQHNNVVGVQCDQFKDKSIWLLEWEMLRMSIWNPVVWAVNKGSDVDWVLWDMWIAYKWRIKRILKAKEETLQA